MWKKSREIEPIFQLVPLLFSLQVHFMSLKSGRSQLVLAIIWIAQLVFLLPISFWFYVCMPSFILIFHMSVELWFGDLWERVDCPTMARRYWSLWECHQLWSLLRILGRKDNYWDQARAGGKYGAGTDHGKSPQMQTGPEERRAGAVAKIQWGAGSQQRCCLARALAVKQSWFWLFHGLKQSALLALICLWSGAHHGKMNTQRLTPIYYHSLFSGNARVQVLMQLKVSEFCSVLRVWEAEQSNTAQKCP